MIVQEDGYGVDVLELAQQLRVGCVVGEEVAQVDVA